MSERAVDRGLIPGRSPAASEDWKPIAGFLIRSCGLSEDDVRRILALKDADELRFSEAALRLGLVTQADVDAFHARPPLAVEEVAQVTPSSELVIAHDPFDLHAERIRALRTELLLRRDESDEGSALAVISAHASEGRSRLAAELAVAFAQLGQSTLLVDADLRHARQQVLFPGSSGRGLATTLARREAPRLQSIAGLPHLSVLLSGERPANPLELLSDPLLGELLSGWKRRFRHILFDTPPIAQYSDALATATHAGQVLVVTRAQVSPMASTREMLRRLAVTDALVLGAVVNHF